MVRILIVEDNVDIARLYQSLFARHDTVSVETVYGALALLNTAIPDLVILDFHLPDAPGLSVLDYIRAQPTMQHTQVWGISADDMLVDDARQRGMDRFFRKPLDIPQLMTAFNQLLERGAVAA